MTEIVKYMEFVKEMPLLCVCVCVPKYVVHSGGIAQEADRPARSRPTNRLTGRPTNRQSALPPDLQTDRPTHRLRSHALLTS